MELATRRTHRAKGSVKPDKLFKSWQAEARSSRHRPRLCRHPRLLQVDRRNRRWRARRLFPRPLLCSAPSTGSSAPLSKPWMLPPVDQAFASSSVSGGTNATELIRPARAIAPVPNPYPAGHRSTRQDRIDGGLRISKMNSRKLDVSVYEGAGFRALPQYVSALSPLLKSKGRAARPMTWRRLWASPSAPRVPRM